MKALRSKHISWTKMARTEADGYLKERRKNIHSGKKLIIVLSYNAENSGITLSA